MVVNIINTICLPNIPSASGIEIVDSQIFIIGDDSNLLFVLDASYKILKTSTIYNSPDSINGKIAKNLKLDFEALTIVEFDNRKLLLAFGSGSKINREKGVIIDCQAGEIIQEFSLGEFYDTLKSKLQNTRKLNIEGLAADVEQIYLLHRGNVSRENLVISLKIDSFFKYISTQKGAIPSFQIFNLELPSIHNVLSGFSGACKIPMSNYLLFTASVENTANEIDDGETFGSFIGIVDIETQKLVQICKVSYLNGDNFKGKIESISIVKSHKKQISALCVTDMDGKESELLEIEILIE